MKVIKTSGGWLEAAAVEPQADAPPTDGRQVWMRTVRSADLDRLAEAEALETANARLRRVTNGSGLGIFEWDLRSGELVWSAGLHRLYGIDPALTVPTFIEPWRDMLHPDDLPAVERAARSALATGSTLEIEFRVRWPDGSVHHLRASGQATCDERGRAERFVGANWDVTASRRVEARVVREHERLAVLLESLPDGVITTDLRGNVTWLNPVAEHMTGWLRASAIDRPIAEVFRVIDQTTRQAVGSSTETVLVSRSSDEFAIESSAAPIRDASGHVLGTVVVFHDVTERRRLAGEAIYRAARDPLTGLANRAEFHATLRRLIAQAESDRTRLAVLFIDLDRFKAFNDTFGHAVGDLILQAAATRLRACVRHADFVARLGGDEFVVVSPNLVRAIDANAVAQKILAAFAEPLVLPNVPTLELAGSVGIAVYPDDAPSAETLLHHADLAMYRSKARRHNGFARFDASDAVAVDEPSALERRLGRGLENAEFLPFYQPVIDLRTGKLRGLEALARWQHPQLGIVPPSQFIALAAQSQLSIALGEAMLRTACRDVARWRVEPRFATLEVSINLCARQLAPDGRFASTVSAVLREADLPPAALVLEVTENLLLHADIAQIAALRELSAHGVRIALDDFGTGSSALGSLRRFPVDIVKIDQSILDEPSPRADRLAMLRAIIAMAHNLSCAVVAEGVESNVVFELLRAEHCDAVQGFLIGKPLPFADATAFIAAFNGEQFIRSQRRRRRAGRRRASTLNTNTNTKD